MDSESDSGGDLPPPGDFDEPEFEAPPPEARRGERRREHTERGDRSERRTARTPSEKPSRAPSASKTSKAPAKQDKKDKASKASKAPKGKVKAKPKRAVPKGSLNIPAAMVSAKALEQRRDFYGLKTGEKEKAKLAGRTHSSSAGSREGSDYSASASQEVSRESSTYSKGSSRGVRARSRKSSATTTQDDFSQDDSGSYSYTEASASEYSAASYSEGGSRRPRPKRPKMKQNSALPTALTHASALKAHQNDLGVKDIEHVRSVAAQNNLGSRRSSKEP